MGREGNPLAAAVGVKLAKVKALRARPTRALVPLLITGIMTQNPRGNGFGPPCPATAPVRSDSSAPSRWSGKASTPRSVPAWLSLRYGVGELLASSA